MNKHIIHRQVLDLKLKSKDDAFAMRQRMQENFLSEALPVIEKIFDEIAGPAEVLYIDKLELDLGIFSSAENMDEFIQRLEYVLKEKLHEQKAEASVNKMISESGLHAPQFNPGKTETQIKTLSQNRLELLEHFIETGRLPWWATTIESEDDFDEIIQSLTESEPDALTRVLIRHSLKRQSLKRILFQLPEKTLQVVIKKIAKPGTEKNILSWIKELSASGEPVFIETGKKKNITQLIAATLLHHAAMKEPKEEPVQFVRSLFTAAAVMTDEKITVVEQSVYETILRKSVAVPVTEIVSAPVLDYLVKEESRVVKSMAITAESIMPPEELPLNLLIASSEISFAEKIRIIEKFIIRWFSQVRREKQIAPVKIRRSKKSKVSGKAHQKNNSAADENKVANQITDTEDTDEQKVQVRRESVGKTESGNTVTGEENKLEEKNENTATKFSGEKNTEPGKVHQASREETGKAKNNIVSSEKATPADAKKENKSTEEIIRLSHRKHFPQSEPEQISFRKIEDEENTEQPLAKKTADENFIEATGKNKIIPTDEVKENSPAAKKQEDEKKTEPPKKQFIPAPEEIQFSEIKNEEEKTLPSEETKTPEEEFIFPEEIADPPAAITRYGGLVMVANLLPFFFETLNLIEDDPDQKFGKRFVNDAAAKKAVFLLHFIATGKTKASEHALVLHKILCGMNLSDTLPKSISLSKQEKEECLELLTAIAEQWAALKTESGEIIRANFMRRDGILEKKNNEWLLRIERGALDIMLETFPWSYGTIKLPWMSQLLHVEW